MPRISNVTPYCDSISSTLLPQDECANNRPSNHSQSLAQNVRSVKIAPDKVMIKTNMANITFKKNDEYYFREWKKWQDKAPYGAKNTRKKAVLKLRDCLDSQNPYLKLSGLNLNSLPVLPPHITKLNISLNQLKALPKLPDKLKILNCSENNLENLISLPNELKTLNCSKNKLMSLPKLPSELEELDYSRNDVKNIPRLPDELKKLDCSRNNLEKLPKQPNGLQELNCSHNCLENLPIPPKELKKLNCSYNRLQHLPEPHHGLQKLNCSYNRLTSLPKLPDSLKKLACSENSLVNLPRLPDGLKMLDCSENGLVNIHSLPSSLEELISDRNELTVLPELPTTLQLLYCEHNRLESLPNLPTSMTKVAVSHNQLTELPELHVGLDILQFANNRITSLPESIANQHSTHGIIDLSNNPLSERTVYNIRTMINDANYRGPWIFFSMASRNYPEHSARPLTDSVICWFSDEHKQEMAAKFSVIANQENATAFSAFIDRLHDTCSAKKDPQFKQHIAQWISRLSEAPKLRETTFAIALGATESCEDRVALTWNDMQKVELIHNIESGKYDDKLPELVTAGREMFRLEQLEHIAREKVTTLHFVDEIEVYIGFQTQLRTPLELACTTKEMRFFGVSGITESDLNVAELRVKTAENQQFPEWLAQWSPWQKLVERTEPTLWEQACNKKMGIYESEYQNRINVELAASGLSGDIDAERALGIKVMHDIDKAIFIPLTQNVLANKKQELLLNKKWTI